MNRTALITVLGGLTVALSACGGGSEPASNSPAAAPAVDPAPGGPSIAEVLDPQDCLKPEYFDANIEFCSSAIYDVVSEGPATEGHTFLSGLRVEILSAETGTWTDYEGTVFDTLTTTLRVSNTSDAPLDLSMGFPEVYTGENRYLSDYTVLEGTALPGIYDLPEQLVPGSAVEFVYTALPATTDVLALQYHTNLGDPTHTFTGLEELLAP